MIDVALVYSLQAWSYLYSVLVLWKGLPLGKVKVRGEVGRSRNWAEIFASCVNAWINGSWVGIAKN